MTHLIAKIKKNIQSRTFDELMFFVCRHIIGRKASSKISYAFYNICKRFPLREDVLIFQTEGDFCDNGRALYDYLMALNDKKRTFVWQVKNPKRFSKRPNTVFLSPSRGFRFRYFYYLAVAKNIIETHNLTQIELRQGQNYISLWHGMMIKRGKASWAIDEPQKPVFNYLLNSSKNTEKQQAEFLGCDAKYVVSLGFPRNDVLVRNKANGNSNPFTSNNQYKNVILWMPTFRASNNKYLSETTIDTDTGLPLLTTRESLYDFSKFCKSMNVLLIIKIHHLQAEKDVFNERFDNILFVQDEELLQKDVQLYEMIAKTDALLTDVSSVFVDYLLLNKPMGFILTDFNEYQNSRGVLFDNLIDLFPGELIYKIDDMKQFLRNVCSGVDGFEAKRDEVMHFFHDYPDGNSCERIKDYFNL